MTSFHYKVVEEGTTIEYLLREQWQAGKKTVHHMRMEKSVTGSDGEPIEWRITTRCRNRTNFTVPDAQLYLYSQSKSRFRNPF